MASAELVSPTFIKKWQEEGFLEEGVIHCDYCSIAQYSLEDYDILFSHKKLAYFFFLVDDDGEARDTPFLCHNCLFNELKKLTEDKQEAIRIILLDDDNSYECDFMPEELFDGDPDPDPPEDEGDDSWPFFPKE